MAVSRQVNDGAARRLLDQPGNSGLLFQVAARIQHLRQRAGFLKRMLEVSPARVAKDQWRAIWCRSNLACRRCLREQITGRKVADLEVFDQEVRAVVQGVERQGMQGTVGDDQQMSRWRGQQRCDGSDE